VSIVAGSVTLNSLSCTGIVDDVAVFVGVLLGVVGVLLGEALLVGPEPAGVPAFPHAAPAVARSTVAAVARYLTIRVIAVLLPQAEGLWLVGSPLGGG